MFCQPGIHNQSTDAGIAGDGTGTAQASRFDMHTADAGHSERNSAVA